MKKQFLEKRLIFQSPEIKTDIFKEANDIDSRKNSLAEDVARQQQLLDIQVIQTFSKIAINPDVLEEFKKKTGDNFNTIMMNEQGLWSKSLDYEKSSEYSSLYKEHLIRYNDDYKKRFEIEADIFNIDRLLRNNPN